MSRNSQQRRANNKRRLAQQQRQASTTSTAASDGPDDAALERTIRAASQFLAPGHSKADLAAVVTRILGDDHDGDVYRRATAVATRLMHADVSRLFECGWQPADLAHLVKRRATQPAQRLATALIAVHSRHADAVDRAPASWLGQLEDLGVFEPERGIVGGYPEAVAAWIRTERLHPDEVIAVALQILGETLRAPRLSMLIPPPSKWGNTNRGVFSGPAAATRGEVDAKALKTIRALLAKAEATTFEAEAETFTAKAQEMMTRYSIDAAVLDAAARGDEPLASGIESLRVHIESPYADEKASFLSVIADVNSARSIWSPQIGIATVMGFPVDLRLTDLLFTSLLVQATRASAEATGRDRSLSTASFRRAFLVSFADRIGERLEATRQHASHVAEQQYGSALVPILADRALAVDEAFTEAFPNVQIRKARSFDAAGWYAGRAAADRAHIGAGAAIAKT